MYKKIVLSCLMLIILSSCSSQLQNKDENTQKKQEIVKEFPKSLEEKDEKEIEKEPEEKKEVSDLSGNIEIFFDFECPSCKKFEKEALFALQEKHPDVTLTFRHFPLNIHKNALNAAKYAVCAEDQGKEREMRKELAEANDLSEKNLGEIVKKLQMEGPVFTNCLNNPETFAKIEKDQEKGRSLGVVGTPTFFIGGMKYEGAYPLENLEKMLRDASE